LKLHCRALIAAGSKNGPENTGRRQRLGTNSSATFLKVGYNTMMFENSELQWPIRSLPALINTCTIQGTYLQGLTLDEILPVVLEHNATLH